MYYRDYGDCDLPGKSMAELPQEARMRLAEMDYSKPERACPSGLTISELMREALRVLTQGQWFEAQVWPAAGKVCVPNRI